MLPISLVGSYMVFNKSAYSAYEYPFYAKIPMYVYAAKSNGYFDIKFKARDTLTIHPDSAAKYKNIILMDLIYRPLLFLIHMIMSLV